MHCHEAYRITCFTNCDLPCPVTVSHIVFVASFYASRILFPLEGEDSWCIHFSLATSHSHQMHCGMCLQLVLYGVYESIACPTFFELDTERICKCPE